MPSFSLLFLLTDSQINYVSWSLVITGITLQHNTVNQGLSGKVGGFAEKEGNQEH